MKIDKCPTCGEPTDDVRNGMCFTCRFWHKHLIDDAKEPPHKVCMIDGTHYIICDEDSKSSFRGFDGAKFQIEFNDGTRVITTNLWCQGEPEGYWRQHFPDNARFENNLKWVKIGNCSYLCKE